MEKLTVFFARASAASALKIRAAIAARKTDNMRM
jgi:hypothetical protein